MAMVVLFGVKVKALGASVPEAMLSTIGRNEYKI